MAGTKTDRRKSDRGKPARGRPAAGRKAGRGKPPAARRQAAGTRQRRPAARKPVAADSTVGDHVRDLWGLTLLVLAALTALGLYADAAGIVGVYLDVAFRGLFGVLGLAAPIALTGGGVLLLREPRPANRRVVAGGLLVGLGAAGLWHLAAGAPGFDATLPELQRAAGWAGAAVALPLRAAAATGGAVVILVAVVASGLMLATATPPRALVSRTAAGARALRDRVAERRARRALEAEEAQAAQTKQLGDDGDPTIVLADDADPTIVLADDADTTVLDDDAAAEPTDEDLAVSDTKLLPGGVDLDGAPAATMLAPPAEDWASYELPDLSLLRTGREAIGNKRELDQMRGALERTLHQFNVGAHVSRLYRGPTVTRFEVTLEAGVKVAAVTKLGDDISYALATPEIRIVAPIPGKSAIGIEVPNRDRDLITLGDVLRSTEAARQPHPLGVGIGKDIAGNAVIVNLATMPHLLIAGATGSGKSVTMNAIVTSLLMRTRPDQVRMILVDPKRVELNHYEGAPHLLNPVVTDPKRATEALEWTVREMEQRYERLAMLGYRNIDSYNGAVRDGTVRQASAISGQADTAGAAGAAGAGGGRASEWEALPYIVFVIDELSDLMMIAPRDVESHIVRISQMARAVGIHLIVATQRPSVDVVTGLIKANVPSRIALAMATGHDSKTILDQHGAEKLVGDGDMLYMPANASKPHRIQGCYIDESEIEGVVAFCKAQREADYTPGVVKSGAEARLDVTGDDATDADLTTAAMELVVRSGLGSTSMLQRKLKVGFARAGRLMDELEEMGVVGPSEGPKARQVLMGVEEYEERLADDTGEIA
ncbi:MAG TPA: DNA translocase FtsK [Egibacteraceae bacterium]|nr:DNA translocase FtsK [Egibacteraceae bacterium]